MACREMVTLAELEATVDLDQFSTDDLKQQFLERITDKVYSVLGHSFGLAMRIYHDESVDAAAATVQVTATGIVLVITDGANAGTETLLFADYPTMWEMSDAIEALEKGWVPYILDIIPFDQPSGNLKVMAATDAFGIDAAAVLCFAQWQVCGSGNNEHYFFVPMPILSVVSVVEDGITLTANTHYRVKYLWIARHLTTGSCATCWRPIYWSCAYPCNVCVVYIPRWFGRRPAVVRNAIIGLAQLELESGGALESEKMGDYSYTKGDFSVAWSTLMAPLGMYKVKVHIG